MRVLSLFDGMSCGQIALNRIGITPEVYYASELKRHAIDLTQHNYPATIQLGDVRGLDESKLKSLGHIDLLTSGSPCQDFSGLNPNQNGLEGNKSSLFYEFLRILEYIKPKYFLLENVKMPPKYRHQISKYLGVDPIRINSSLVSAQQRDRLYWTNIGPNSSDLFGHKHSQIPKPNDKQIKLQDILTWGYTDMDKAWCLVTKYRSKTPQFLHNQYTAHYNQKYGNRYNLIFNSPDFDPNKGFRLFNQTEMERLQTVPEGYTSWLTPTKAHDVLGDGWTVDVIAHILRYMDAN